MRTSLIDLHSAEFTDIVTDAAFDAFILDNLVRLVFFPDDGIRSAVASAEITAVSDIDTGVFIDGVDVEVPADMGGTFFVLDVGFVFISEILHGGQDGVGRCVAQSAESRILDGMGQLFEKDRGLPLFLLPW